MSRSPDFNVKALRKDTDEKSRIGAGWKNPDGSVSVVLDAFVTLTSHPQLIITLFPVDDKGPRKNPPLCARCKSPDHHVSDCPE